MVDKIKQHHEYLANKIASAVMANVPNFDDLDAVNKFIDENFSNELTNFLNAGGNILHLIDTIQIKILG